jgi:3-oxoacyl-[acyl-carrier protein] reductase
VAASVVIRGPAIVTGGGQGLGRAFCLAFASAGVPVVVADLNADKAGAVSKEIEGGGGAALAVSVDVSDASSVKDLRAAAVERFGGIGVLVNNAAIFSTLAMRPFGEIPLDEWARVLEVNVTGTFLACREVVPVMREVGYGKIVNISSATIWIGRPGYLHYVTSKAALVGLTRALAAEVGPDGIRVNAITPGSTETEVERATITPEARRAMAEATALRRIQMPEDLTGAVLFLSSSASDFVTGQTVNVDGGFAFH